MHVSRMTNRRRNDDKNFFRGYYIISLNTSVTISSASLYRYTLHTRVGVSMGKKLYIRMDFSR